MSCSCSTQERLSVKLINIVKHNEETYSYDFQKDMMMDWYEGDSSKLFLQSSEGEEGRKFSHASLPEEEIIRFTTRIRPNPSAYKKTLSSLKIGDRVEMTPPSGHFRLIREDRPIVLISNGVGIAAVRSLVKAFDKDDYGIPFMLQINVDHSGEIYDDEFEEIARRQSHFKSVYTKGRKAFYQTLDYELQKFVFSSFDHPWLYVVGSDEFVEDTIQHLTSVGYGREDILTDGNKSAGGTCGCSSTGGCGCGSNIIQAIAF